MKAVRFLIAVSLSALAAVPSWAAQPDSQDHEAHHPAAAASAPKANAPAPKASASRPVAKPSAATQQKLGQMDGQMKMMADMHQKMMGAKTPEERGAMMGDNMKMMQDSMSMMNMMGGPATQGSPAGQGMSGSMEDRVQMMEKRMDMMQMMMQMMMDARPDPASK